MRSDELLEVIYEAMGENEQTKTDLINHFRVWLSEKEASECLTDFCKDYEIDLGEDEEREIKNMKIKNYHVEMYANESVDEPSYQPYTGDYCVYDGDDFYEAVRLYNEYKETEGTSDIVLWSYEGNDFYEAIKNHDCKAIYQYHNKKARE
jgi:hypothetical protein